ncbi:GntR family transcriptional regulator [Chelativorans sp.]|uniref:GntR family transcriptional regulator n=1 Tax=Chelativorans sp. TaxID=2203393 RepID=UPI00281196CF|nr:GntR family transcriptional regulator [Chelativorans sp.]
MGTAPLYLRIASDVEAEIRSGRLKAGQKIESERVLAEKLGVSRMTARQALRHLSVKGLIETRTGQGTFVGNPRIEQRLETLSGFTEEMARQGRQVTSLVLSAETHMPDETCRIALALARSARVHCLVRVRLADGVPVALESTEIPAERTPDLLERADFSSTSLYGTLRSQFGIMPTRAEQSLTASIADAKTARTLQVEPGAPVLKLTRLARDQDGRAFEFVRSVYRGDFFVMKVHLTIGACEAP